jgi:hypothetical protein
MAAGRDRHGSLQRLNEETQLRFFLGFNMDDGGRLQSALGFSLPPTYR